MVSSQVIQGTVRELEERLRELDADQRLTLIVPVTNGDEGKPVDLHDATPEERARALDEIAHMNRNLHALPPAAFLRENLYEERF